MKISLRKNKNIRVFSKKTARQIEVLKRYYHVDIVERKVIIPYHFKKTSDFVDTTVCGKNNPVINHDFLVSLSNIIHSIPIEFNVSADIIIDDYEGYDKQILLNAIKDDFEIFCYDVNKEKNKNGMRVSILIIFGITVLAWLFFICSRQWVGKSGDPLHDLIHEIVYTVGAVVFWEAIYIIFLPDSEYNSVSFSLLSRINGIALLDKNHYILAEMNEIKMKQSWLVETRMERRSRKLLLAAGTMMLCIAGYSLTTLVAIILDYNENPTLYSIFIPLLIVGNIISILSGIGAVSFYIGKGPFRRMVPFFGVIVLLSNASELTVSILQMIFAKQNLIPNIVVSSLLLFVGIIYLVATIILSKHFKPVAVDIENLKPNDNAIIRKRSKKK